MNRRAFAVWPLIVTATALIVGAVTYGDISFAVAMFLLTIAACGIYGVYPVVWSIATDCAPPGKPGLVTGGINIGVLRAFLGPYVVGYARTLSDTFASGLTHLPPRSGGVRRPRLQRRQPSGSHSAVGSHGISLGRGLTRSN
jgi:MFS family permease